MILITNHYEISESKLAGHFAVCHRTLWHVSTQNPSPQKAKPIQHLYQAEPGESLPALVHVAHGAVILHDAAGAEA